MTVAIVITSLVWVFIGFTYALEYAEYHCSFPKYCLNLVMITLFLWPVIAVGGNRGH